MKTLICRTCGCSLVRLGITEEKAATRSHEGEEHRFCCQLCVDLFVTDPKKYLQETTGLIVCPTCLGEKPLPLTSTLQHGGQEVHFCRCPYCMEMFQENPDYYIKRLEGTIPTDGVTGHDGCAVKPE